MIGVGILSSRWSICRCPTRNIRHVWSICCVCVRRSVRFFSNRRHTSLFSIVRMEEIKWPLARVHSSPITASSLKWITSFDSTNLDVVPILSWPCHRKGALEKEIVDPEMIEWFRYIQYLCDLSFGTIERPHFTELTLFSVNLSPVPLFNRERSEKQQRSMYHRSRVSSSRNGCRPFVDVYNQEQKKIFSTYQDPSKLRFVIPAVILLSIWISCV